MGRALGAGHGAHEDPGQAGGSAPGLQPADHSGVRVTRTEPHLNI